MAPTNPFLAQHAQHLQQQPNLHLTLQSQLSLGHQPQPAPISLPRYYSAPSMSFPGLALSAGLPAGDGGHTYLPDDPLHVPVPPPRATLEFVRPDAMNLAADEDAREGVAVPGGLGGGFLGDYDVGADGDGGVGGSGVPRDGMDGMDGMDDGDDDNGRDGGGDGGGEGNGTLNRNEWTGLNIIVETGTTDDAEDYDLGQILPESAIHRTAANGTSSSGSGTSSNNAHSNNNNASGSCGASGGGDGGHGNGGGGGRGEGRGGGGGRGEGKGRGEGGSGSGGDRMTRRKLLAEKPGPKMACHFCRGRKIACSQAYPGSNDPTCGQCHRRNIKCEYPAESRRGMRKKKRGGHTVDGVSEQGKDQQPNAIASTSTPDSTTGEATGSGSTIEGKGKGKGKGKAKKADPKGKGKACADDDEDEDGGEDGDGEDDEDGEGETDGEYTEEPLGEMWVPPASVEPGLSSSSSTASSSSASASASNPIAPSSSTQSTSTPTPTTTVTATQNNRPPPPPIYHRPLAMRPIGYEIHIHENAPPTMGPAPGQGGRRGSRFALSAAELRDRREREEREERERGQQESGGGEGSSSGAR
ncbi:hypothetical protein BD410DRAFT_625034 [Rickenella mellea]|uniref:Zn(2)-C6 fungal-type domain-containing protein n=1 Tax=Rickenella mellea TaxID=50990 RepID=A0A4Y7PN47_9AGAM|nr:hypothetical protein BD410DRAFT_625034 [Rickenella mellea]